MPLEIDFWDAGLIGEALGESDIERVVEILESNMTSGALQSFRSGLARGRQLTKRSITTEADNARSDQVAAVG